MMTVFIPTQVKLLISMSNGHSTDVPTSHTFQSESLYHFWSTVFIAVYFLQLLLIPMHWPRKVNCGRTILYWLKAAWGRWWLLDPQLDENDPWRLSLCQTRLDLKPVSVNFRVVSTQKSAKLKWLLKTVSSGKFFTESDTSSAQNFRQVKPRN